MVDLFGARKLSTGDMKLTIALNLFEKIKFLWRIQICWFSPIERNIRARINQFDHLKLLSVHLFYEI